MWARFYAYLKRVQRHMKKLGIRSIVVKKYRPNSTKKVYEEDENLLKRDFTLPQK